jgi:hypothetical protein
MFMELPITFTAASIPRFLHRSRLPWLRLEAIIGSWAIEDPHDIHLTYDVIMLPEPEFMRARTCLTTPQISTPALRYDSFTVSYIPKDIKHITIFSWEKDPTREAARHFIKMFGLDINRTIYGDDAKVVATVATRVIKPTSCTRMISAPRKAAIATRAAVPASRSPTGLLRIWPMKDFREGPNNTGYPKSLMSAR